METFIQQPGTNRRHAVILTAMLIACLPAAQDTHSAATVRPSPQPQRIVFLGDSITYSGLYVAYIEAFLATRLPERRFEFLNLGLPSETVSGLSEPGHADGAFPRPDLQERLQRVLEQTRPDLVVACYGMNDGIYYPFGEERFHAYQDGIRRLVERVRAAHARLLLVTPPTFDPVPLQGRTLPAGRDEYRQAYEGYNEVLDRYSAWLLEQRQQGWDVVDVHGPMNHHLQERRRQEPTFLLAGDGVHATPTGHLLMAQAILLHWMRGWGLPAAVDEALVDVPVAKAVRGQVADLSITPAELRFTWQSRRPMPMDPRWDAASVVMEQVAERLNRHRLTVTGAPAPRYRLYEQTGDGQETLLATVTREELAAGLDLLRFPALSSNQDGAELLKLIQQRQKLLTDAYLTTIGHRRPGMARGLPLAEAQQQAAALEPRIRGLAAPVTLHLRLSAE